MIQLTVVVYSVRDELCCTRKIARCATQREALAELGDRSSAAAAVTEPEHTPADADVAATAAHKAGQGATVTAAAQPTAVVAIEQCKRIP